jgi:hypothetical protein
MALVLLQLVATGLHVVPSLVYPHTALKTTRVVAEINSLGPVWVLLFGVTSLGLGAALWWNRGETYAHLACAGTWVFYATGLWIGAFGEQPHGTILFPVVATMTVLFHTILAASYNEDIVDGGRPRP